MKFPEEKKLEGFRRHKIPKAKIPETFVEKWSYELLDEGFVPFPKRTLRALPMLFPNDSAIEDLAVILSIADYKRAKQRRTNPSLEYLAFTADMDPSRFATILERLVKRNWITREGPDEALHLSLEPLNRKVLELTPND